MIGRWSVKFSAVLVLIGILLPYFSAFALIADITGIGECALRNSIKAILKELIKKYVKYIIDSLKELACAAKEFFTLGLLKCKQKVAEEGTAGAATKALLNKEQVEDVIERCIARQALTRMTRGALDIARKEGRDGGPAYVQNWRDFTLQGQQRGENIWRGLLYIAANGDSASGNKPLLCKHIRESEIFKSLQPTKVDNLVQSGLNRRVDTLEEYLVTAKCDPVVENKYSAFTQDFNQGGGWDMLERLSLPQNNIFGAIELASQELIKQRSIEEKINLNEATAGRGFTSIRGQSANDSCLSFDVSGRCIIYKDIKTPGFTIADAATNAAIKSEFDWLISADEMNELLVDMFFVVTARLRNLGSPDQTTPPIELTDTKIGGKVFNFSVDDVCTENVDLKSAFNEFLSNLEALILKAATINSAQPELFNFIDDAIEIFTDIRKGLSEYPAGNSTVDPIIKDSVALLDNVIKDLRQLKIDYKNIQKRTQLLVTLKTNLNLLAPKLEQLRATPVCQEGTPTPTPPPPGACAGTGTPDYAGDLQGALDKVIADNPDGIADLPYNRDNGIKFLNFVADELKSKGFNATTNVLNGNGNPNPSGDLIAVWKSGDSKMERYDALKSGQPTIRQSAYVGFTGDIPLTCVP